MHTLKKWLDIFKLSNAKYTTKIEPSDLYPGGALGISLNLQATNHTQNINQINAQLNCYLTETTDPKHSMMIPVIQQKLINNFTLQANQHIEKFFLLDIPLYTPISNEACQFTLSISTDSSQTDTQNQFHNISILNNKLMQSWFDSLAALGFSHQLSWFMTNKSPNDHFPYQQKFRYRNTHNPMLPKSLDLIFQLKNYSDYLDIFLDIPYSKIKTSYSEHLNRLSLTDDDTHKNTFTLLEYINQRIL